MSSEGCSVAEIARVTRRNRLTVRRWLHRFIESGCQGLAEGTHSGRPPTISAKMERALRRCVLKSPRDFGIDQPFWTTASLAKYLERRWGVRVTDECVRQHLERVDAVCRRPTWTVKHLAREQPGYAQKKGIFPGYYGIRREALMFTWRTRRS